MDENEARLEPNDGGNEVRVITKMMEEMKCRRKSRRKCRRNKFPWRNKI